MNRQVWALPCARPDGKKWKTRLVVIFMCVHTGISKFGAYLFKMLAVGIQLERLVAYMNLLKI